MSAQKLTYLDESVAAALRNTVPQNLDRYRSSGFNDLAVDLSWSNPTRIDLDPSLFANLDQYATPDKDAEAALLVWSALKDVTPSLAREGRIWTRLCHVECLAYSRARWPLNKPDDVTTKQIQTHFFGSSQTAVRDDNAIGRLWWGAYVASQALPEDHDNAVKALFRRTDTRLSIMERSSLGSRAPIVRTILKAAMDIPNVTASERNFREFMKALNRSGSGMMFELMSHDELDVFAGTCTPSQVLKRVQKAKNVKAKQKGRKKQKKHK